MDSICEAEIIFVYTYLGSNESRRRTISWDLMLALIISERDYMVILQVQEQMPEMKALMEELILK